MSLLIICSIATIVALKFLYNKSNNELNSHVENTTDNLKEWQPGDIVVFIEGYEHIGITSDKRDEQGIPYVIHNSHPSASEGKLSWFNNPIHGQYRWQY